jgi:exopolyphosphatase/guanosine-5'-triphosphate,3'-diphosphate pyrophosphatase
VNPSSPAAALDIGSNSIHLLVAQRGPDGAPRPLLDVSHQAGIGGIVDATGMLGPELRREILGTLDDYLEQARGRGAGPLALLGTEALRMATDASGLAADVMLRTGLVLMVIDRTTEGLLTLLGVAEGKVPRSLAVVDIGGGSTEVTVATPDGPPVVGIIPVGSARLAARHIRHDPVTEAEVAALRAAAREHVADLEMPRAVRGIVAGGSGTNLSRLLGRPRSTPIDRDAIEQAFRLLRSHPAEVLAARTGLTVRRVGQLAAGSAIGEALFERLGLDVAEVSDASLREGAIIAMWEAGEGWLDRLSELVRPHRQGGRPGPATEARDRAS